MPVADYCICTVVAAQALTSLLEAARELGRSSSSGQGIYRDSHPWLVARELLDLATSRGERMAVMFAVEPSAGEREGLAPRMEEPSAGEREGPAPRMEEPSAGEREGPAPRMEEPSAGEREGPAPRMEEPSAGEREGPAPRKKEPSAGEREGPAPRMEEPSAGEREGPAPRGNGPLRFSHWAHVRSIEVHELHKGAWETRCAFAPLEPVNPIWEPLDSVVLAPSAEQCHRERVEPIKKHRQLLDANLIRPYAVCETPAFIAQDIRIPSGTPT